MAAEVRPIRTKRDYETALKEVERLGVRVDHKRLMVSAGTAALAAQFAFKKVKP